MISNNIHYLQTSIDNKEEILDDFYLYTSYDKNIDKYVEYTKKLKDILITIKTLKNKKLDINNELYFEVQSLINSFAKKSEFACFITACDCNIDIFKENNNIEILKKIIDIFLKKRDICEFTYREWIQAILDSGSSRKKGVNGQNKLIEICKKYNYNFVNNFNDFINNKKVVANFTKNGDFSIKNLKNKLDIDLNFGNQNKILDIFVKNNNQYFCIEAKHIKTFGGEQDKQIHELINIIKKQTNNKNIHYIAFLDGIYSNHLLTNKMLESNLDTNKNKIIKQQYDIIEALKVNTENFWLNTNGFIGLLKDLEA